ncbi:hypothetical protein KUCAC02_009762, partial [Chaenocephalus aceratus]
SYRISRRLRRLSLVLLSQTELWMRTASGLEILRKADMFVFHILPPYTFLPPKDVREPPSHVSGPHCQEERGLLGGLMLSLSAELQDKPLRAGYCQPPHKGQLHLMGEV